MLSRITLAALIFLCGCATEAEHPTREELEEERGTTTLTFEVIASKEETPNGNRYFISTRNRYCKLGVTPSIAPVSDFCRIGLGGEYKCIWTWGKRDDRHS